MQTCELNMKHTHTWLVIPGACIIAFWKFTWKLCGGTFEPFHLSKIFHCIWKPTFGRDGITGYVNLISCKHHIAQSCCRVVAVVLSYSKLSTTTLTTTWLHFYILQVQWRVHNYNREHEIITQLHFVYSCLQFSATKAYCKRCFKFINSLQ